LTREGAEGEDFEEDNWNRFVLCDLCWSFCHEY